MTIVFKTENGAERVLHTVGDSGWSRRDVQPLGRGYVIVYWWGSASAPTDARVYGPGLRIIADGVEAAERLLGLRD